MKRLLALLLVLCCLAPAALAEEKDSYNWYEVFVYSYQDSKRRISSICACWRFM